MSGDILPDALFPQALELSKALGYISASKIQSHLRVGCARSARLRDLVMAHGEGRQWAHKALDPLADVHARQMAIIRGAD